MEEEQKIDIDFEDANPKSKSGLVILLVSIIIILGVVLGIKFLYIDNPSRVFINGVNSLKNSITSNTSKVKSYNSSDIKVTLETLGILRDYDINDISKYTFKVNTLINKNEKEAYTSLVFKDGLPSSKGINIDVTYKDNLVYSNIYDIYEKGKTITPSEKVIKNVSKVFDKDSEKDVDRVNYVINKSYDLFKPSISKDKFSKKSVTVLINGKSTKLSDYIYTLDKNEIEKIKANTLNGIINDDAAITYLSLLTNIDTTKVKNYLRKISNSEVSPNTKVLFHIYTKGLTNEIVGYGLDASNYESIRFYKINNDIEFEITNKIKASGKLEAGNKINVLIGKDNKRNMIVNIREKTEDELDLGFTIEKNSKGMSFSGDMNLRKVLNDQEANILFSFNLDRVEDGFTSTIKFDLDATLKDNVDIKLEKSNYEETSWSLLKNDLDYYKDMPLVDKIINQVNKYKNKEVGN